MSEYQKALDWNTVRVFLLFKCSFKIQTRKLPPIYTATLTGTDMQTKAILKIEFQTVFNVFQFCDKYSKCVKFNLRMYYLQQQS